MLGPKVLGLLFTFMLPGSWSYSPCHQWEHQLARCNVEFFRSPGSCGDDYWADLVRVCFGFYFRLKSFFRYLKRFFEVRRVVWRRQKGWSSWIIERECDFVVKKLWAIPSIWLMWGLGAIYKKTTNQGSLSLLATMTVSLLGWQFISVFSTRRTS